MYRYLIIRADDALTCLNDLSELFIAVFGMKYKVLKFDVVGVYDDVVVIGVPRGLVQRARALVALMEGCRTVKVRGTVKSARRTATSIRRRPPNA